MNGIIIDKNKIGIRIAIVRKSLGMSQARFAKALGMKTRQAVKNWESGKNLPKEEQLNKICEIGKVTSEWLFNGDRSEIKKEKGKFYKLITRVKAGEGMFYEDNISGERFFSYAHNSECFAVKVEGKSMERGDGTGIMDGSICLVDPSSDILNGNIVVGLVGDQQLIKQYIDLGDKVEFRSFNPSSPSVIVERERIKYLARVVIVQTNTHI